MKRKQYEAAGGVVLDAEDRVLLLERWVPREEGVRHEIRLPKGHIDPGESAKEAALREVCEESGYCQLEILAPLGETVTRYEHLGEQVTRKEIYFLMRLREGKQRVPDVDPASEEALFTIRWAADLTDAEALLTYESEKLFAHRACEANASRRRNHE